MEEFQAAGARVLIRPDCKPWLWNDLAGDFRTSGPELWMPGRSPHVVCRPEGAPFRVLVRKPTRGGIGSFLGPVHLTAGRIRRERWALDKAGAAGLNVPELLAVKIVRRGIFKSFVCVYRMIEEAATLEDIVRACEGRARWTLLQRVAQEVRRLHEVGIRHGDLNARNVLIVSSGAVAFVDLDGASPSSGSELGEIFRLCRSLEKLLGGRLMASDQARLLRGYLPGEPLKPSLRKLERHLARHRCWWKVTS
jgi:hypothetical protein